MTEYLRYPDHEEERSTAGPLSGPGAHQWVCPEPGCPTRITGDEDAPDDGDGRCPVHRDRTLHHRSADV